MKQYPRIHVQNLGPIREAEFEVRDFMVFVGPQASGKSTLAAVVHLMASFWREVFFLMVNARAGWDKDNFLNNPIEAVNGKLRMHLLRFLHSGTKNLFIECYWSAEFGFVVTSVGENVNIEYSNSLNDMMVRMVTEIKTIPPNPAFRNSEYAEISKNFTENILDKFFAESSDCSSVFGLLVRPYYIPTDRIAASYIVNSYADFVRERFSHTILAYSDLISEMRIRYNKVKASSGYDTARELMLKILRGRFEPDPMGMDRLYYGDQPDEFVYLTKASSGQQDAAWMAQSLAILIHDQENAFIVIEEPEGHLFPEGQKMMTDLLGLLFNAADNRLVITTHSPYILSALNNLFYAAAIGGDKDAEVDKIVDRRYWIPVERVGAYLLKDGQVQCMIEPDSGLIRVSLLNTAMDTIDGENDLIFNVEYGDG